MGTVPIGTGELRRIHSRVAWMSLPVDRSITVSAPQRVAHTIFSTSSAIELVTAELPMLALTLVAKRFPMIIGSLSAVPRPALRMPAVGGDGGAAGADLLAHHVDVAALPRGDESHLGRDQARAGPRELRPHRAIVRVGGGHRPGTLPRRPDAGQAFAEVVAGP